MIANIEFVTLGQTKKRVYIWLCVLWNFIAVLNLVILCAVMTELMPGKGHCQY